MTEFEIIKTLLIMSLIFGILAEFIIRVPISNTNFEADDDGI